MSEQLTAEDLANAATIEQITGASEEQVLEAAETFAEIMGDTVSEELAEGVAELSGDDQDDDGTDGL